MKSIKRLCKACVPKEPIKLKDGATLIKMPIPREVIKTFVAGKTKFLTLACGHILTEPQMLVSDIAVLNTIESKDGEKLLPHQPAMIQATERANGRFLMLDEQGLGKMVMAITVLKLHPEMLPALIVCKSRLKMQWWKHLVLWTAKGMDIGIFPEVLDGGKERPHTDIFQATIVSLDSLWRMKWIEDEKEVRKFKTIIVDEFQKVKNPGAARTQGFLKVAERLPYFLGLSGTPIMNHAGEFWPALYIIDPDTFGDHGDFLDSWVDVMYNMSGTARPGGIKKHRQAEFRDIISQFSLRRERIDAMPGLPTIFRQYTYHKMDQKLGELYQKELAKFAEAYGEYDMMDGAEKGKQWARVSASLMHLKYLTGLAKVDPVMEYVEEFLEGHEEDKLTIFHHHIDVGTQYQVRISSLCEALGLDPPIRLSAEVKDHQAQRLIDEFKTNPRKRILICRQLAEGEGLNLQACGHVVQAERQWNPANEEQPEGRFPRPGSKYEKINVQYPVALGTVDEILAKKVEIKRQICQETYGKGAVTVWHETSVMKEVAQELMKHGLKEWGKAR